MSILTIPVEDLAISENFYSNILEWTPVEPRDKGIIFYQLVGIRLALYPKAQFINEIEGRQIVDGSMTFTLAYNTKSKIEVDEIFSMLKSRGVRILKEPEEVFWGGYSGYFADPDGHSWEVAYSPFTQPNEDGSFG